MKTLFKRLIFKHKFKSCTVKLESHNKNIVNDKNIIKMMEDFQYNTLLESTNLIKTIQATKSITHLITVDNGTQSKVVGFLRITKSVESQTPEFAKESNMNCLDWLYIKPECRKLGIGSRVLEKLFNNYKPFYLIPNTLESEQYFKRTELFAMNGKFMITKNNF